MPDSKLFFVFGLSFIGLCSYQCLQMIPERAHLQYYDKQYFESGSLNVRRNRRGGDYYLNLNFTSMQYLGNNVTISFCFYEFLNNQFKPSFIQLHYKLCDLILKDKFMGMVATNAGLVTCPLIPGNYILKNLYFNQEIPSLWPFDKGMLQVVVKHDAKPNGIIGKGEVVLSFTRNVPQKRNQTKKSVASE